MQARVAYKGYAVYKVSISDVTVQICLYIDYTGKQLQQKQQKEAAAAAPAWHRTSGGTSLHLGIGGASPLGAAAAARRSAGRSAGRSSPRR